MEFKNSVKASLHRIIFPPAVFNHAALETSRICWLEVMFTRWCQRLKVTELEQDRVSCFPSYKRMRRQTAEATVLRHSSFYHPAHCPDYWLLSWRLPPGPRWLLRLQPLFLNPGRKQEGGRRDKNHAASVCPPFKESSWKSYPQLPLESYWLGCHQMSTSISRGAHCHPKQSQGSLTKEEEMSGYWVSKWHSLP